MFCNKCGVAVENNVRKCPQCGHFIKIDKNLISYEEKNDVYSQRQIINNYVQNEYISSAKVNNEENNNYNISSYEADLDKYRKAKEYATNNIGGKPKINWGIFIILLFINPFFAFLYVFIISITNKTIGRK